MKHSTYIYRSEVICKHQDGWFVIGYFEGMTLNPVVYKTLDDAKNAIDKNLGGYSGKCMPNRWLKDEKLKCSYSGINQNKM